MRACAVHLVSRVNSQHIESITAKLKLIQSMPLNEQHVKLSKIEDHLKLRHCEH
jgi:hypothetical protein